MLRWKPPHNAWKKERPRSVSFLIGFSGCCLLMQSVGGWAAGGSSSSPLALPDLIAAASRTHPSVAAKQAENEAARFEVEAARRQYWPAPSAQVLQDGSNNLTTLRLTQPLWAGGRIDAGLAAAAAREQVAREGIGETRRQLALRLADLWQGWLLARGRIQVLRDGIGLLERYEQSVKRRQKGGFAGLADLRLVQARISQMRGDLLAAQLQERVVRSQISLAAGVTLQAVDPDLPLPVPPVFSLNNLAWLIQQAEAADPLLRRLQRELEVVRQEAKRQRAMQWPTLNLVAQHQQGRSNGLSVNDNQLMLTLEYAPGAGLDTAYAAKAAWRRVAAAQAGIEARRRELVDTVSAVREEAAALLDRKQRSLRSLASTRAVLASYERQFTAGRKTWLEVVNAARERIQAEVAVADINAQLAGAVWRLRILTGQVPGAGS